MSQKISETIASQAMFRDKILSLPAGFFHNPAFIYVNPIGQRGHFVPQWSTVAAELFCGPAQTDAFRQD
jgi:hypothetical protein